MNRRKDSALTPALSPRERENHSAPLFELRIASAAPQVNRAPARWRSRTVSAAFTLVEMLVVISIIGILAALIIGVLPAATEKRIRSRVKVERDAIQSAIERYKLDKGFYPPDNTLFINMPPLYYELQGFDLPAVPPSIRAQAQALGITNIINIRHQGVEDEDAKNFLKNVRQDQIVETNGVRFLAVKVRAPDNSDFTLWGYDMRSPNRHNNESFDLWADVKIGNKVVRLGNWSD